MKETEYNAGAKGFIRHGIIIMLNDGKNPWIALSGNEKADAEPAEGNSARVRAAGLDT